MKKMTALILALCLCLSLSACGGKPVKTGPTGSETDTETAAEDISDVLSEKKDLKTGKNFTLHNGAVILHPDSVAETDKKYRIEGMYSEILTDRAIDRTWEYYYTDTAEDGSDILTWSPADGCFTSVLVLFECTNISDEPCKYGEDTKLTLVFDEGGNEKVFNGISFQTNPGQISAEDCSEVRSTVCVPVEKDEKTVLSFLTDIDKSTHDALVEDEIKEPSWAYIEFGNGDRYCVNLREDMIKFGYDDSDDESCMTAIIYRTLKAATGAEYMKEFLESNPDFSDIAVKAGVDTGEAAECFSALFSLKVDDIVFDSETSATAYCTLTSPDFYQMYLDLDEKSAELFAGEDKSQITEEEFAEKSMRLLLDYTKDGNFPFITDNPEIVFKYDEGLKVWGLQDKEALENKMRAALLNF